MGYYLSYTLLLIPFDGPDGCSVSPTHSKNQKPTYLETLKFLQNGAVPLPLYRTTATLTPDKFHTKMVFLHQTMLKMDQIGLTMDQKRI